MQPQDRCFGKFCSKVHAALLGFGKWESHFAGDRGPGSLRHILETQNIVHDDKAVYEPN